MTPEELSARVARAGVVGAGGAGFPTAVKLKAKPEYIIVNGAECEPLLKVDQQLSEIFAARLMTALNTLVSILGAKGGIFALKEKYHEAVAALQAETTLNPNLSVATLGNYYPMGDEQVLVYEVLGRIVPEGGLPINAGVVVINVESLLNIALAMEEERAVVAKYVTVTGEVASPSTFRVPIGLEFSELIAEAGGATVKDPVIISGGPMMGHLVDDLAPVTKTTKGLIVLDRSHPWVVAKGRKMSEMMRIARTACCHCMFCSELCPRNLLGHQLYPDKLMRLASYGHAGNSQAATGAFLCCECGLCELACVMSLQPWRLNHELKISLAAEGIKNPHHQVPDEVHRFREVRRYPIPKLIQRLGLGNYEKISAHLADYNRPVKKVRLLLKQHLGAPGQALVAVGDQVERGQAVATPTEGALGATVHSSLSGRVTLVDNQSIVVEV